MPRRGCRSSASNSVASSSIDRPIVPPAPAEFSISSQVCPSSARRSAERGHDPFEARLEPGAEVRADVEDDCVRADRAAGVDRRAHDVDALLVEVVLRAGEVDEVERMDQHPTDPELPAAVREGGEVFRVVLREPPRTRALNEQLQ